MTYCAFQYVSLIAAAVVCSDWVVQMMHLEYVG